jgi:hypothetical protein
MISLTPSIIMTDDWQASSSSDGQASSSDRQASSSDCEEAFRTHYDLLQSLLQDLRSRGGVPEEVLPGSIISGNVLSLLLLRIQASLDAILQVLLLVHMHLLLSRCTISLLHQSWIEAKVHHGELLIEGPEITWWVAEIWFNWWIYNVKRGKNPE